MRLDLPSSLKGLLLSAFVAQSTAVTLTGYEYIIIGSGAGGGPLAARLAMAGHKTLLIEAGSYQGGNVNYTVPAYQAKSTEDPVMDWSFYVRHYASDERTKRDYKLTYTKPDGSEYVGLNPPPGSTIKGILYPRAQMLGGCTGHNALVSIYPFMSDFQYIADLTGDQSWGPQNLRKYFVKMEHNTYLAPVDPSHGYSGWFYTSTAPLQLAIQDLKLFQMIAGAASALGSGILTLKNYATVLAGDANGNTIIRDTTKQLYQVPISTNGGQRWTTAEFLLSVSNAKYANGTKMYPLDIRTDCYVTKVTFDKSGSVPKATGVEFLDGKYLYRASPMAPKSGSPGTPGSAKASREVVIAGGSYNSPQILKLSGIGPQAELQKFGIPIVKDLPGVGTNLQDHYEVAVQGSMPMDFETLDGPITGPDCTFGFGPGGYLADPCYQKWASSPGNPAGQGAYASSGFAAAMMYKSSASNDGNWDELAFGGPVNFRGYFPGYSYNATQYHNWWTWALLKAHPRNNAGTVTLRSANPLDVPNILFNYFDTGSGDYKADLQAIYETIQLARNAITQSGLNFTEILPGAAFQTQAQIEQYVLDTAWGHHCSCTCPIGADGDPMAVLDSSFRVRGVSGLRVVDASVFPKIPGVFTLISTYMVSEKAADVMLSQST